MNKNDEQRSNSTAGGGLIKELIEDEITMNGFAICKREIIKFFNEKNEDVKFDKELIKSLIQETPVFINGVAEENIKLKEEAFYGFWAIELLAQANGMYVKNNYTKITYNRKEKNIYSYNDIDSIRNKEDEATFSLAISHILSYWKMFFALGQGDGKAFKEEYEKRQKAKKETNAENPKLKPEDDSYKLYMNIIQEIITKGEKKSKIIFNSRNGVTNFDLQNEKRKFDSFCKNHKDEILKKFSLTKKQFRDFLFPRTVPKKLFYK